MRSGIRWAGLYLLNLLVATLGVLLASGILLNVVLKPVSPLIGHSQLFSVVKGPYYPLQVVLALAAGYVSYIRLKGNHRFWVWVVPTVYLAIKIALWKDASVLADNSWDAAMRHFFAPLGSHYPEEDTTLPFYTSVAYSLGALLEKSGVFRFEHPEDSTRPSEQN